MQAAGRETPGAEITLLRCFVGVEYRPSTSPFTFVSAVREFVRPSNHRYNPIVRRVAQLPSVKMTRRKKRDTIIGSNLIAEIRRSDLDDDELTQAGITDFEH